MKIRGEYWITDYGTEFADGDVSDWNHSGYVISQAQQRFLVEIGADSDAMERGKEFEEAVAEWMREECPDALGEVEEAAGKTTLDALWEVLEAENRHDIPLLKKMYKVATGGHTDERIFAMKEWGWAWVRKTSVGIYQWNEETRKLLIRGLGDILEQEYAELHPESAEEEAEEDRDDRWNIQSMVGTGMRAVSVEELRNMEFGSRTSVEAEAKAQDQVREMDKSAQHPYYGSKPSGG